jgi:hypothetical protein
MVFGAHASIPTEHRRAAGIHRHSAHFYRRAGGFGGCSRSPLHAAFGPTLREAHTDDPETACPASHSPLSLCAVTCI